MDIHQQPAVSALMLSDRLLSLAEAADHAGCMVTATHLLSLAYAVFDEPATKQARRYGGVSGFDPGCSARQRRASLLSGMRVGLVWAGNPRLGGLSYDRADRRRSLSLALLAPLALPPSPAREA